MSGLAPPGPPDGLRGQTISGIGWSTFSRASRQGVQLVFSIVLARLLSPDAFGLIGMITVLAGFANILMDFGFGAALVQRKDATPDHAVSVFWLNVAAGLSLMLLFMAASPLIAWFYAQPVLVPLTLFVSLNFFLGSFVVVHLSLLRKRLDFRRLAVVELSALVASGLLGVALAVAGFGVWSLAGQSVALTLFTAVLLFAVSGWRPALRFRWGAVRELLPFSANLAGFSSFNYWIRNTDKLLIGRFLTSSDLGIYNHSYAIMLMPLALISQTIGQVLFPAFSSIQEDRPRVAAIYLRVTRAIALVTFPMMVGLWAVADHFVLALLGERWAAMVPILEVFCLVGLLQSIGTVNGNLYLSQGRSDLQLKVGGVIGLLGIAAIVVGLRWGIEGVANAYAIFSVVVFYPSIRFAVSLVGLTVGKVLRNLAGAAGCAAAMGGIVWGAGALLPGSWPHWAALAVLVAVGVAVYAALVRLVRLAAYVDLKETLLDHWRRDRGPA